MVPHRGGIIFSKLAETITRLVLRWRHATAADRYRPEKHYMRGLGPKPGPKAGPKPGPKPSGKADGDGGQNPTAA
jgi:hypothetical protein